MGSFKVKHSQTSLYILNYFILTDRAIKEESSFIENSIKSGSLYFERYSSSNYLQLCNPSSLLMQFFSKQSLFKLVRLSRPSILCIRLSSKATWTKFLKLCPVKQPIRLDIQFSERQMTLIAVQYSRFSISWIPRLSSER